MHRVSLTIIGILVAVALAGCKGNKPEMPPPPPMRVTVIQPVSWPVLDYWYYNGYLETTEAVEVRSKIRGFLMDVKFTEGEEVTVGKLLYDIDDREFKTAQEKAIAEVESAKAQVKVKAAQQKQAEADFLRAKESYTKGGVSKSDLDLAEATAEVRVAEVKANQANLKAAEAALHSAEIQLGYTDIRAKINGRISRTLQHKGNLVLADTTLLTTILRVDELYIYFDAPEADLVTSQKSPKNPLNNGGIVELGVTKEEGFPHIGTIDFRENRVETSSGTIRIRGRLQNPMTYNIRSLIPGMYARVRVLKGEPTPQLVVPEDCLLSAQEGRFLYVIGADNKVEKRIVTVGASVWKAPVVTPGMAPPGWVAINPNPPKPVEGQPPAPTRRPIKSVVAITAGLQSGDRVILDGIQKVRPGAPVDPEMWNMTTPTSSK
jgi:RND family efflux transporter MFP subunit